MPQMNMNQLVEEYYNKMKPKLSPSFTFEAFDNICRSSWKFFLTQMERNDTPEIYMMYLGTFKVFSESVEKKIKTVEMQYRLGLIGEERLQEKRRFYYAILKRVKNEERGNEQIEIIDDVD